MLHYRSINILKFALCFHNNFLLYTRAAGPCSLETGFYLYKLTFRYFMYIRIYFFNWLKIRILILSTMNLLRLCLERRKYDLWTLVWSMKITKNLIFQIHIDPLFFFLKLEHRSSVYLRKYWSYYFSRSSSCWEET